MDPLKGIALKVLAVIGFIVMSSLIKHAATTVPPGELVFFRSFFAIPVIFIWMYFRNDLAQGVQVVSRKAHFWRGVIGTTAMVCFFTGLGLLPLPEATALSYAMPLMTVIFAAVLLHEPVGVYRYSAVALGIIGVVIVLEPRLSLGTEVHTDLKSTLGAIVILFGAVCAGLVQIHIRQMVQTERTASIVFYFSLTSTILSLLTLPFGWVIPSWDIFGILVVVGLLGGVSQILQTSCYRYAPASVVAPFDYLSMVFAIVIGFYIFDEVPTAQVLFGAALIVIAGIVIILREAHLGLAREKSRKVRSPLGD